MINREEIDETPANKRGKKDVCSRCNTEKTSGSGHPVKVCLDGVPIKTDTALVPYPQPVDLFVGQQGRLNMATFNMRMHTLPDAPDNDTISRNFAIFANYIIGEENTINMHRLAFIGICMASEEDLTMHKSWRERQAKRQLKLTKRQKTTTA